MDRLWILDRFDDVFTRATLLLGHNVTDSRYSKVLYCCAPSNTQCVTGTFRVSDHPFFLGIYSFTLRYTIHDTLRYVTHKKRVSSTPILNSMENQSNISKVT